ncbi:hypothetical protein RHO14_01485 [Orbus wheelerorum]|uniref:hypothetical protein n=1 Tax=Orbus wheelerorum TaxID=3074111 RepID=UPI00370D98BA
MKKMISLLFISSLSLVGCTTTDTTICDPTNKNLGILDKMSCNFSGHYQERVDQKTQILIDEQATNSQFKALYAEIEKQKNDSSANVKQKQADLNRLQKNLTQLTDELKQKAIGRDDLQQQIKDIDQQLNTVKNSSSSEIEKQVELDSLNNKLKKLQKALSL